MIRMAGPDVEIFRSVVIMLGTDGPGLPKDEQRQDEHDAAPAPSAMLCDHDSFIGHLPLGSGCTTLAAKGVRQPSSLKPRIGSKACQLFSGIDA